MKNINNVILSGRLTKDCEIKPMGDGHIVNFSIAVNTSIKKNGAWEEYTSFFDCVYFSKGTKIAEYLVKGKKAIVSGELRQERWEKDNNKYSRIVVRVEDLEFIVESSSSQNSEATHKPVQKAEPKDYAPENFDDSDIPW